MPQFGLDIHGGGAVASVSLGLEDATSPDLDGLSVILRTD